jgi:cytochrome c peroxidase
MARRPFVMFVMANSLVLATVSLVGTPGRVSAHHDSPARQVDGWYRNGYTRLAALADGRPRSREIANAQPDRTSAAGAVRSFLEGRRLFDQETFGGNGRTCLTCHSESTGTVSPEDARERFRINRSDPLFVHDGSDDEDGDGVGDGKHATRMLTDATVLMRIPLHPNVTLKHHPAARFVTVRRGIPTTINTPALDPVLMLDGRQPTLESQALGAITDHAEALRAVHARELELIATFQRHAPRFFSSLAVFVFAHGGDAPKLPEGRTAAEKRGRRFFDDVPPDFSVTPPNFKAGACAVCHSGPLLNQTNQFLPLPVPAGTRFQTVLVSEINEGGNPPIDFVFHNQDVPAGIIELSSPDPGRALVTGRADDSDPTNPAPTFDNLNAFKIPPLRGIRRTAPYFHDNSAKTLEDVLRHYRTFFSIASDPDGPGPEPPLIDLTDQDQQDIVAFLKLLD